MARKRQHVSHPEQIRLLSSPVRQEIIDTLAALGGEATAAALAEQLGRPADGLYYHLRELVRGDLVVEQAPAAGSERRFRLKGGNAPVRLAYQLGPGGNGQELAQFARTLLQITLQDFQAALALEGVVTHGPRRELWVSRNKGWLSADDRREVVALLERLSELTSQPRAEGRDRLMSLGFSLAPIRPLAKRRGDSTK